MARRPRLVLAGQPHLVMQRSRGGEAVFADPDARADYLQALGSALRETGAALHGYGLLAAEARLLVTPRAADDLARLLQSVGRRHVRAMNRRSGRHGTPWDGRFRSAAIDVRTSFIDSLRFAECEDAEPFASSRAHHVGASADPLVTDHAQYWALGNTPFEREAAYRQCVEHPLPGARLESLRVAVLRGLPIGSDVFVRAAAALTGRPATLGHAGRPSRQVVG